MTTAVREETAIQIRTPFVLLGENLSSELTQEQVQMETQFVTLPIPVFYHNENLANIIGVGQSGREYVIHLEDQTVFSGLNAFIDHLVARRTHHTRSRVAATQQRIELSLHGKRVSLDAWFDMLCGWADTSRGTVACIKGNVALPERTSERAPSLPPRRIIRLPEPPLRPPTISWPQNTTPMSTETELAFPMVMEEESEEESEEEGDHTFYDEYPELEGMPDLVDESADEDMPYLDEESVDDDAFFLDMPGSEAIPRLPEVQEAPGGGVPVVRDIVNGDGLLTLSQVVHRRPMARRERVEIPTECTICCGLLTDGLKPPCGNTAHVVCGSCLNRHATNWSCHCVSPHTPFVSCLHEGCDERYSLEIIAQYISDRDLTKLKHLIDHYTERQRVAFACPTCHEVTRVDSRLVKDRAPGTLAVACFANGCGMEFCWHCLDPLPIGSANRNGMIFHAICNNCEARTHCSIPARNGEFNRFVPKTETVAIVPRNYELTVQDCIGRLRWIATTPQLDNHCRACMIRMHRSTACAELTHCGLRVCTVCGMSGLEFESNLIDHWGSHGRMGQCPRWTTDRFWREKIQCPRRDRCEEGRCHDDDKDCTVSTHENYRTQLVEVRRLRHFKCLLQSLPPPLQRMVIEEIVQDDDSNRPMVELFTKIRLARDFGALI